MKKGFVISWFFPPINSSEGIVTFKLLKNSKFKYDVFTQKDNKDWSYGNKEDELVSENIETINGEHRSQKVWAKECIDYFKKNSKKYNFIMSRAMPMASHEVALEIKKEFPDKFWIASFGDPVANSPYVILRGPQKPKEVSAKYLPLAMFFGLIKVAMSPKNTIRGLLSRKRRNSYFKEQQKIKDSEQEILRFADKLIFNNSYQLEYMLRGFSKEEYEDIKKKSEILPHSFERSLYPKLDVKKEKTDVKKIVYLGHLDDTRSPKYLFRALNELKKTDPSKYKKLSFDFYGTMDDQDRLYIYDHGLYDIVKIKKPVEYVESLKIMAESDWCLLIDGDISEVVEENIYFPGKLADYLGSGAKILAITMLKGASADIIRDTGNVLASYCVDDIKMKLIMIADNKYDKTIGGSKKLKEFDAKNVAKIYDEKVVPSM